MRRLALCALAACGASAPAPAAPKQPDVELHVIMTGNDPLPCDGDLTTGVHGKVTRPDGTPVAGVTVTVVVEGAEAGSKYGVTDEAGCYAAPVPGAGSARVGVFYGDASYEQPTVVPAGGFGRVDATLLRDGTER